MSGIEQTIDAIIRPSIEGMGYRLVRISLRETERRRTLQIMAERRDGRGMKVEDCEQVSHQVSTLLDVDDPISGAYHLEVSSPGIDRPLIDEADFARHQGFEAKIETSYPIEGRKRYRGPIVSAGEGQVTIEVDGKACSLPIEAIASAKLILSDELIHWYQAQYKPDGGKEMEGGIV